MPRKGQWLCVLVALSSPALGRPPHQSRTSLFEPAHPAEAAARIAAAFGVVTSTFRTVEHNRAVGGVPNSYHLLDRALDIVRRPGVSHAAIAAALRAAGYTLVESLDEGDHSHFAFAWGGSVTQMASLPQKSELTKWGVVTVSASLLR